MKTFNPKVSIIIPVYNGSNYLKEAIDSALAQTYKNIEIIVINDGSNDKGATEKIAKSYGNKIRYFKKKNGGVATALNLGIKKMTGEYFSWLSHDDMYYPDKIEKQIEYLSAIEEKQTVVYSSCTLINEIGEKIGSNNKSKDYTVENLNSAYFALFKGLMNGCAMLIHRDNFKKIGLFNPKLPTTQDYQLWYEMFKVFPVKFINKDLIKSRIHNEQGSIANPGHTKEADDLWTRMIKGIEPDDIAPFAVNRYVFYKDVEKHLKASPLTKTYTYVKSLVNDRSGLVSVIMPTYNRAYCIEEAIKSVYSQDYGEYELIIVDDGSTDGTEKIVKKIMNKKTIYIKQKNKGASSARNHGIKLAQGEFIAFIDSDDYWTSDHLGSHIETMVKSPDSLMSFNDYSLVGLGPSSDKHVFRPVSYPDILFISHNIITTPSVMVRSEALRDVGLFDESMSVCEDIDLWRRIAKNGAIKEINKVMTIVTTREDHHLPDDYLSHRYTFLHKAIKEDESLKKSTITKLLLELQVVYFSCGTSMESLAKIFDRALRDFDFLHTYMNEKIIKGELGFYVLEDDIEQGVTKKHNANIVKKIWSAVLKFKSVSLKSGIHVAFKKSVNKVAQKLIKIIIPKNNNG